MTQKGPLRVTEEQVNVKCVFCGAMITSRRIDAITSELLAFRALIDNKEMLFCNQECYEIYLKYEPIE